MKRESPKPNMGSISVDRERNRQGFRRDQNRGRKARDIQGDSVFEKPR